MRAHFWHLRFKKNSNGIRNFLIQGILTFEIIFQRFGSPSGLQFLKWEPTYECASSFPHIFLHFWSMKCDFWAYLSTRIFASLCFSHELKVGLWQYGVDLGFRSPNLNLKCSVMILTPKHPSSNTSSIVLFPICIWIIAIWLYVIIVVVLAFGTEELTCFFVVALFKFWVFFYF